MTEGGRPSTATVLFTDLVGSTGLRRALGDDRADELRRRHDATVRIAVTGHLGTEVKGTGDGLMVVFPAAAEAVAAAIEIQRGIARLNRAAGWQLEVRVGISAGDVAWDGEDCFGTPVVEACRLCDTAQPGQILTSEVVRLLAGSRGQHGFDSVGPFSLKGLGDVTAFAVSWEPVRGEAIPLPSALAPHEAVRMVGRLSETSDMERAWKEACEGTRRVMLVAGEPGVGKTRLAAELARAAFEDGAAVLFGRCEEELGVPYQPFSEALQKYVATCGTEDLADQTASVGGELVKLVPLLANRLSTLAEPIRADPETERFRLFEAVEGFLAAIAATVPVLLIIDDLHWAAKPTLLLLRYLVRQQAPVKLLVVATYRDTDLDRGHPLSEMLADLRREPDVERVVLHGLDDSEVIAFVSSAAGHDLDEDGEALARAVHAETEGNPFFIGQVLRHLVETGKIRSEGGRWIVDRHVPLGIPEGVREVIGKRLSQLDENANEVLSVAALIGREFDTQLLTAASGVEADRVLDGLEAGEAARLILPVADHPERRTFAHALVRSTLYEEIPTTRRLRLHRRVAVALERRSGEGGHLEELARHFCEAAALGETDSALRWVGAAAEEALERLAYEEAAVQYERGLHVLDPDSPSHQQEACELEIALARARRVAGEMDASRQAALRAVAHARRLGRPDHLVEAALVIAGDRGWSEAGLIDEELVGLLEEGLRDLAPGDSPLRARAGARLASELYFDPRHSQRRQVLTADALAMAQRTDDPETLGFVTGCALWGSWMPGNAADRLVMAQTIAQIGRDTANRLLELAGRFWEVGCRAELGDRAGLDEAIEAEKVLADQLRIPEAHWGSSVHRAAAALLDGRFEDAMALADEALGLGQRLSLLTGLQMYGVAQFAIRRALGGLDDLVPVLGSMVEQYPLIPAWRCGLAFLYRELGWVEEARTEFEVLATNDFSDIPTDANWKVGIAILSTVCSMLNDVERAARLYEMLSPHADSMVTAGMPADILTSAHLPLGLLAATLQRWEAMENHMTKAVTRNESFGCRPWTAVARLEHAAVLIGRNLPGDAEKARELIGVCRGEAASLGMTRIVELAEALKSSGVGV